MTDLSMTAAGTEGLLAIWHDVAPGHETRVREWYDQEHHAERLSVPGFLSAHRYERRSGAGRALMNLYRTATPQVLASRAYLDCLQNPSERTRAAMPHCTGFSRSVCQTALARGGIEGPVLAVLAVSQVEAGATCWPIEMAPAFEAALKLPGVLRCRLIANIHAAQPAPASTERRLRGAPDEQISWAVLLDVNASDHAQALQALAFVEAQIGALSSDRIQQRATYNLVYAGMQP